MLMCVSIGIKFLEMKSRNEMKSHVTLKLVVFSNSKAQIDETIPDTHTCITKERINVSKYSIIKET